MIVEPVINPNKALWEKGDFTRIANTIRESGAALVKKIGITAQHHVLDLGCGDGNTAIPSAQLGAQVLGVDIATNLVAAGNRRAAELGLSNCRFQEGCATNLKDLSDDSFDVTMSIFGAMFAPKPHDVAKHMVRVTRPGGRIIMGNWIPGDPTLIAQILKISSAYTPPPPAGFISPVSWGQEEHVYERFMQAGIKKEQIICERDTFTFVYGGTPADYVSEFKTYYGPTMNAFAAAETQGRSAELQQELEALFTQQNRSGNKDITVVDATYLRVTAFK
jgi:SAM-dependent methyltransferase